MRDSVTVKHSHGFLCQHFPAMAHVELEVTQRPTKKRKHYCRECMNILLADIIEQLYKELRKKGWR